MTNEVTKQDEKMATQFEVNGNPGKLSAHFHSGNSIFVYM